MKVSYTEDKHFRGAAAVHALSSELLLLGFNVAFPTVDKSSGDDLLCTCNQSRTVKRIQVRSRHVRLDKSKQQTISETVKLPVSLVTNESTSDLVCIAIRNVDQSQWHLGLLGRGVIGKLVMARKGSSIQKAKHASEGTIDYRIRLRFDHHNLVHAELSGEDVTPSFAESRESWVTLLRG